MSYPDLPHIPELPSHRPDAVTPRQILDAAAAALHAAERAVHQLEHHAATIVQLSLIRTVVIECRRSTFVLQKLRSRVQGFDEWYLPKRTALAEDELMSYFRDLRNLIEKEGLPGTMAEMVDGTTGEVIADVACGEGVHGIWVSGAARSGVPYDAGPIPNPNSLLLRNFRLPDPPRSHRNEQLTDFRFSTLAGLAIDFLWAEVVHPARERFSEKSKGIGS